MKRVLLITFVLLLIIIFISMDFDKTKKVKIGFVAGLSGKYSYLGHGVLNGAQLALDEVNFEVNGIAIEFIQKDDQQNAQEARKAIREFAQEDVNIIIGNTTSSMTKESLAVIKEFPNMLLFSPTASSNDFSNIDDNFLRTQVSLSEKQFNPLSKYLLKKGIKRIYMVYDSKNLSYINNYRIGFQNAFINNGGQKFVQTQDISFGFERIVKEIKSMNVDGIVIVANSLDSSQLVQLLRLEGFDKQIVASGWSQTKNFIENGGQAVDDVLFTTGYDENSKAKKYLEFVEKYRNKFDSEPSVFSAQAYETMQIILEILRKDGKITDIKEKILMQGSFQGLQGEIRFTQYGDVDRDYFLVKVKDNRYIKIEGER